MRGPGGDFQSAVVIAQAGVGQPGYICTCYYEVPLPFSAAHVHRFENSLCGCREPVASSFSEPTCLYSPLSSAF